MNVPETMRAICLDRYHEDVRQAIRGLSVRELPVPSPRHGQVLVKIQAAPCNPSDLLLLQGKYGVLKTLPTTPGWEGAGTVVASGGGMLGGWLRSRRVACGIQGDRNGTWAEYCVANAKDCVPIKRRLGSESAASLIINPFTAWGLLESARRAGHAAAVQTAGASQLGRMLVRLAADVNFPLVSIVRRSEQVDLLESLGAEVVLNSSDNNFVDQLTNVCKRLNATAAFEAVAGNMTGTIINALPPHACVYVYGALAEEPCGSINPIDLIFQGKTVTGFYLGNWLRERGIISVLWAAHRLQKLLIAGTIETQVGRTVSLDEVVNGLLDYVDAMTAGKTLIMPHGICAR